MTPLVDDWHLIETAPDAFLEPTHLANENLKWLPASVPGTVAQSMQSAGQWSLNEPFDFDHQDYWYKTEFSISADRQSQPTFLHLEGLATLCEVWLNGQCLLKSDNMFLAHQVDLSNVIQPKNSLYLCFRSLTKALSQRKARPRWKTRLVDKQPLRWFRTSLLGRIPSWMPLVAPVGPWKAIALSQSLTPFNISITPALSGSAGVVRFSCDLNHAVGEPVSARLSVEGAEVTLDLEKSDAGSHVSGELCIDNVERWWPHTHGVPRLYEASIIVSHLQDEMEFPLAPLGFRKSVIDRANSRFAIAINGKEVFCRGACWTINDVVSLAGDPCSLEQTLTLMRDAGANMIRIGGTMIYEYDHFYRLCDELGMMVWQDFMFANMDYPVEDDAFNASITAEARQLLTRLRKHACVTLYCGNSEIEQQAAMLGLPAEVWSNEFFSTQLAELCRDYHPEAPYIASTPSGGDLPFHTDAGVTHYYGVGAYRLPVSDVRQHDVKFTSECLGFSNIPVAQTRNRIIGKQIPVVHHPKWKEGVPRDSGAGWDFEDIRDHYLAERFSVNPVRLRSDGNERYLALSEIITGEVMAQVFSEWRSKHSHCAGGLVWYLKDLWPGAGWGIIDSHGLPKAVYYYLKRCWQPINLGITNESLNGLHVHINNETGSEFSGCLEVRLLSGFSVVIASNKIEVTIDADVTKLIGVDALLEAFLDTTYTYRFGPSKHAVVYARLTDQCGSEISSAHFFPNNELPRLESTSDLKAIMVEDDGAYLLELSCNKFLYAVNIDVPGFLPADNFFHLMPGIVKSVRVMRHGNHTKGAKGYVGAINLNEEIRIKASANLSRHNSLLDE